MKRATRATKNAPQPTSWADAVGSFLASLERADRSRHTTHHYRDDLKSFAAWWSTSSAEPLTPEAISATDARLWRDHLRTQPLDDAGRVRKPASINARLSALKSFLTWAKGTKLIPELPEVPRRERLGARPAKSLTKRQQEQLRRAAGRDKDPRNEPLVAFLLETGLRVAELVALRWRDLPHTERKGTVIVTTGKGRKPRTVPLSPDGLRAVKALRSLDPDAPPTGPVFRSQRGDGQGAKKPLSARGVQELLSRLGTELGWAEPLHPHLLRHSFAMNLRRKGVDWTEIARLMGHSSVVTSMSHYGTPSEADLRRAVGADADDEPS